MSQIGEAIAKLFSKEEPEKKVKKKKLKIRFSLFFDGTLNNRTNIEEREKAEMGIESASYKDEGDGGSNSYDNGRTNIAIMEPLIPITKDQKGYNYSFKIYIEGQGTFDRKGDSGLGYAMGGGASGVSSRAKLGIQKALVMLKTFLNDKPPEDFEIEKIDIDVFGFSRGAATARYSIYMMTDWWEYIPLYVKLRTHGYRETTDKNIEIKFAGLYDTVVSVYGSQYNYWSDNKLQQRAVELATQSVHLAAADEHRLDFPLHTIKSAKDKGKGKEIYLPGVHSDVGGSYNLANVALADKKNKKSSTIKIVLDSGDFGTMRHHKKLLIQSGMFKADQLVVDVTEHNPNGRNKGKLIELRTIDTTEYMRSSSEVDLVIKKSQDTELNSDRDWLVSQGWYKPDQLHIDIKGFFINGVMYPAGGTYPEGTRFMGTLVANRKNIKSAYSNIPLKIMAKFARENGIEINPKLEDDANTILSKEDDLKTLEADITSYVDTKGNSSKPEDWLAEMPVGIKADMKKIRNEHLHMSSKIGTGYTPRFKKGKRLRYYYEG